MKLLRIVIVGLALVAVMFAVAQKSGEAKSMKSQKVASKSSALYACPKCEMASTKAGKCACGAKMVKIEGTKMFECPKCHMAAARAGKCAHCKVAMEPMVRTYACEKCHLTSKRPGKCKGCGQAMHKHDVKMMGKQKRALGARGFIRALEPARLKSRAPKLPPGPA